MRSDCIFKSGNALKVAILVGNIDVVEHYSNLVNDMLGFLKKFIELCKDLSKYIFKKICQ
jgi:hypothetical protein